MTKTVNLILLTGFMAISANCFGANEPTHPESQTVYWDTRRSLAAGADPSVLGGDQRIVHAAVKDHGTWVLSEERQERAAESPARRELFPDQAENNDENN